MMSAHITNQYDPDSPCVYCEAPGPDFDHRSECPSRTNLWPVLQRDVAAEMVCCHCDTPFALGDHYTERVIEQGSVPVVDTVCLPCGVLYPEPDRKDPS